MLVIWLKTLLRNIKNTSWRKVLEIIQHLLKKAFHLNSQENKFMKENDKKIKSEKPSGVLCNKYHGFGHMTRECANKSKNVVFFRVMGKDYKILE